MAHTTMPKKVPPTFAELLHEATAGADRIKRGDTAAIDFRVERNVHQMLEKTIQLAKRTSRDACENAGVHAYVPDHLFFPSLPVVCVCRVLI